MDKTRILKAWWRVCVVDRRLTAIESRTNRKHQKLECRYWDHELEKLSAAVSAATKVARVTAEWGDGEMGMCDSLGRTFLRLFTNDPLKIEEIPIEAETEEQTNDPA